MNAFTDEDLKSIKRDCRRFIGPLPMLHIDTEFIERLISRLEAAEWLAGMAEGPESAIEAWRKAAGK